METLGHRVRRLRVSKKLSQREVAKSIGTSAGLISFIERDKNKPSYEVIHRLSILFGVSTDYLISGTPSTNSLKKALEELKQPFFIDSERITNLSDTELELLKKHNVLTRLSKLNRLDLKIILGILDRMEKKTTR